MGDEKVEYSHEDDVESLKKSMTVPTPAFVYTSEEKTVKRKIDRAFLPLVILILFTQVTPLFSFFFYSFMVFCSLSTRHLSTRRRSWGYLKTHISQRTSLGLLGKKKKKGTLQERNQEPSFVYYAIPLVGSFTLDTWPSRFPTTF
jgi:hypothetical protein